MAYTSFGQVVPVLGPLVGFPGNVSRVGERVIVARPVLSTTATNLPFGAGAVLISSATGGSWQSLADYLATATNAANLQQTFAGVAVRNVKTQLQYQSLMQTGGTVVTTTATQATPGATTIVVASATGIAVGQSVEGTSIQANTLVTAVSGTTITISLGILAAMNGVTVSFTSSLTNTAGYYAPGTEGEVLERGSITVVVPNGTAQANLPVYIRTVANASLGGTSVGDFEAANDVSTTAITIGTTAGSTTLTTSAGTGVAAGQQITGPGIAPNTIIVSGATTSWVMSQPALYTIASGGAASFNNTVLLGTTVDPWLVFRTGQQDSNGVCEITIKGRHAA